MRWISGLVVVGMCALSANAQHGVQGLNADQRQAVEAFKRDFPAVRTYATDGRATRIYGTHMSWGATAEESAELFVQNYDWLLGVDYDNLSTSGPLQSGQHTLPLMWDPESDTYKFTLVYFTQQVDGVPIFRSDVRLLVLNEPGFPLVWINNGLHDLGDFAQTRAVAAEMSVEDLEQIAIGEVANLVEFSPPELTIWAGTPDAHASPALAYVFMGESAGIAEADYAKWLFVVEARSGDVLYQEDQVVYDDVVGNVSGLSVQGVGADECEPEEKTAMPWVRVSIDGGSSAFADANGDFVIPNAGNDPVTVRSMIQGRWFRVFNQGGSNSVLTQNVTPPGPANFLHNAGNSEFPRAEVTGYVESNVVRDFVLSYAPDYPTIKTQQSFEVNVNINSSCNAFYNGRSINFYRRAGSCNNTAFSVVVYHEYGHHLVAVAGSGQGQYGEGLGDTMGVIITDTPELAIGFRRGRCDEGIRDARRIRRYPCSGGIHDCGQLLSGCVWETRNELKATNPDTYREIISNLTVNSIPMHRGTQITPQITIDFLELDDDDGNIGNGTPHYTEIAAGFGSRNMDAPPLTLLEFVYPDGRPRNIAPAGGTKMRVEVKPLTFEPKAGSGKFFYDAGEGFVEGSIKEVSENVYDVTFPAVDCLASVKYYLSSETTDDLVVTDPQGAPGQFYEAISAAGFELVFTDDFETDKGWTVENSGGLTSGAWERAKPSGGGERADPPTDFDGSGQCYVTEDGPGDRDIDDGWTRLISPTFDLAGKDAIIGYARWYDNSFGADPNNDIFVISVSNDDGNSWVVAETVGPVEQSNGGWFTHSFRVGEFVEPSDKVRVRFDASDLHAGSVVEAAVDAFSIEEIDCGGPCEPCDTNCDGSIDLTDVEPFIDLLLGGEPCDTCSGDANGDGSVNLSDVEEFIKCLF